MDKPLKNLPSLLEDANIQMTWIIKEIIKQNRSYKDILRQIVELRNQVKNDLILVKDIPDRLDYLVEEIGEIPQ